MQDPFLVPQHLCACNHQSSSTTWNCSSSLVFLGRSLQLYSWLRLGVPLWIQALSDTPRFRPVYFWLSLTDCFYIGTISSCRSTTQVCWRDQTIFQVQGSSSFHAVYDGSSWGLWTNPSYSPQSLSSSFTWCCYQGTYFWRESTSSPSLTFFGCCSSYSPSFNVYFWSTSSSLQVL